jgi:non-haem Fe2+, alpha-ketoglutarate-dependent halogenase
MLTAEQVESFGLAGFVFPLDLYDQREAAIIRRKWDALEAAEGLSNANRPSLYNRHLDQAFLWDIAADQRILDALEPLIGPDILLFGSRVICKWPHDNSFVAWHQDLSVRNQLIPPVQITAWYAIDGVDDDNGCVRCIPASHHWGMLGRSPATGEGNLLRRNEASAVSKADQATAQSVRLRAGQASLHHGFTVHSSNRNTSSRRRCGFVIRYVPAHVRQGRSVEFNQRDTAVVLRGRDDMPGKKPTATRPPE